MSVFGAMGKTSQVYLYTTLAVCLASAASSINARAEDHGFGHFRLDKAGTAGLGLSQAKVERQVIPFARYVGIHSTEVAERTDLAKSRKTMTDLVEVEYAESRLISIDPQDCQLVEYFERAGEQMASASTRAEAVSRNEAMEVCESVFEHLRLPLSTTDCSVRQVDLGGREEGDGLGVKWLVSKPYSHDGIPCFGKGMVAEISVYGGRVTSFINYRAVPPATTSRCLAQTAAVDAALSYLKGIAPDTAVSVTSEPSFLIVQPDLFQLDKPLALLSPEARLAWAVPVEAAQSGKKPSALKVLVDCETGSILGSLR